MDFQHSHLLTSAIFLAVVSMSLGCDPTAIQNCAQPIQKYQQNGLQPDKLTGEVCNALLSAINCLQLEVNKCPAEVREQVSVMFTALDSVREACKNPEEVNKINEECDTTLMERCSQDIQASTHSVESSCAAIDKARKCINDFSKTCDSDFLDTLMESQMKVLDQLEEKCEEMGVKGDNNDRNEGRNSGRKIHMGLFPFLLIAVVKMLF